MNESSIKKLKKIYCFDYFNLFNKDDFNQWISENHKAFGIDIHIFGNLNQYKNRKELYKQIIQKSSNYHELEFEAINLETVIIEYAKRYLNNEDAIQNLEKNIAFFAGNATKIEELETILYKKFWELHEYTELRFDQIGIWELEVKRICKEIVSRRDDT